MRQGPAGQPGQEPGAGRPPPAAGGHLLANALNAALGNVGKTVVFHRRPGTGGAVPSPISCSAQRRRRRNAGDSGGQSRLQCASGFGLGQDRGAGQAEKPLSGLAITRTKSFAKDGWNLPQAHFLESWGDARTADGTLVPIQPLIEPLFGGLTEIEVLARIAGVDNHQPYEIVRETFRGIAGADEEAWKKFLHDGFFADSAAKAGRVCSSTRRPWPTRSGSEAPSPAAAAGQGQARRDFPPRLQDGRRPIQQQRLDAGIARPITKLTWENAILMSLKTAQELGVYIPNKENNRIQAPWVKIELDGRDDRGAGLGPAGQADYTIGLALGYGRRRRARGRGSGYNAYPLRTSGSPHCATGAKLADTGERHGLSVTQDHGAMEGRPIIREATLTEYRDYKAKHPQGNFALGFNMEPPEADHPELYPNPFDEPKPTGPAISGACPLT